MIRFLLPVLLLAFGSCQVPNQSSKASSTQAAMAVEVADDAACTDYEEATSASMEAPSDCCGADADVTATAMAAESDCCSEGAEVAMAANMDACAMQAAGVCADGDDCPMQAAGNEDCDMMGTKDCPMEQAKAKAAAAAAVQASLIMGEGCCAGKTVAEACPDCAAKATAAAMKQCEGMDPAECEAKGGCPSMEAPASVKTGATEATQAGAAKEDSSCCSSKSAEPSN
ncbi:MAG: hypothetical protein QM477_07595 [Planctomycetota bacterium]